MSVQLIKYEAACLALAECKAVDEVKSWHDKAAAMQAYQRMAGDKTLEIDAAEIRIRSERRLGELLTEQKQTEGMAKPGRKAKSLVTDEGNIPKLSDMGISYDMSSRAQKLAAVPEQEFEAEVGEWRERVGAENARVTARLQKAGERATGNTSEEPAYDPKEDESAEQANTIKHLAEENEALKDRIAIDAMDFSEEEKTAASDTIKELRQQVKNLEAELKAVKVSRDNYQRENAEMKKQISMQRKEIERLKK